MTPTPIVPEAKATISVQTLALHMGVSTSAIYAAINQGQIQAVRLGRRVLIPKSEFRRLTHPSSENGAQVEVLATEPRPTDRLVATIADQVAAIGALRKDIRELTGLLQTVVEELAR